MSSGYCIYTLSNKEMQVDDDHLFDGKTWFDLSYEMVHIPAESWAKIKAFIIKVCKTGKCDKQISNWERKIEVIDNNLK
jgi:hypothetical protein